MTLTAEQIAALQHGEPVTVFEPAVGAECVLVRADVFAAMREVSDEPLTAEELRAMAVRAFEDADSAEPIRP